MIFFAQQAQGQFALAHAPGGVDARRKAKNRLPGAQCRSGVHPAGNFQCRHAGPFRPRNAGKPAAHEHAVFSGEGHDVGKGAQRHQIKAIAHVVFFARMRGKGSVDAPHKVKGHAHACKVRVGQVFCCADAGVADGVGRGQLFGRQVVVGNNHGHAKLASALHCLHI